MVDQNVNKPIANKSIFKYHDISIIHHYKSRATSVLEYYRPAINFYWLKKQVDYHMRFSLLFTLARKHRKSVSKIINLMGKNATIYVQTSNDGLKKIASFLTSSKIQGYKRGFTHIFDPMEDFKNLEKPLVKMSIPKVLYKECQVKGCNSTDLEIHHVRALYKKISRNLATLSVKSGKKYTYGVKAIESSLGRKQIPLCNKHHLDIHIGGLTHLDMKSDPSSLKLLNKNRLEIKF